MRKAIVFLAAALASAAVMPLHARQTEKALYDALRARHTAGDARGVKRLADEYLRAYPESPRASDAHFMAAELSASPEDAVRHYRAAAQSGPRARRAGARYRACEILLIGGRWTRLRDLAAESIREGTDTADFKRMSVLAAINLGEYERAEKECQALIEGDHEYGSLARSLLLLAHVQKMQTGYSRSYLATIRDIVLGYGNSEAAPATLYLLGEFYERRGMKNEAYSAYSDCVEKYPGSPEAIESAARVRRLIKFRPRRVFYLPDSKIVHDADSIDIRPEHDLQEGEEQTVHYAISVGPFASLRETREIRRLIKGFDSIVTIRLRNGYSLHVGRSPNEQSALQARIRLAEEYGINGRIVRVSGDGRSSYIYGE